MGWMTSLNRTGSSRLPAGTGNVLLAGLVVGIVAMMILPLPTFLLDVLITFNISIAVILLLVSIYVSTPLRFAVFPSILLITTLYRLGLNVSSTRLILLQADAGEVISSFGGFVVGNNLVVGAVIFVILTLIQFIVIARGSERVAEVAARFTLDAMPGRQMAIDADLRTGAVDQRQAGKARRDLQRESQLYGAMDGAMKFVKGDAIASILITVINITGGLLIGTMQMNMTLADAARVYSLLTIGDGLVSQIPALLISTAAGVVVTRVVSEEEDGQLGQDIGRQVLAHPRAIALAAGLLALLALLPGLPALPFLLLALILGGLAHHLLRRSKRQEADRAARRPLQDGEDQQLAPIALMVGAEHQGLADDAENDYMPVRPRQRQVMRGLLRGTRELMLRELGVALPRIQVRASAQLPQHGYEVRLFEIPAAGGETHQQLVALGDRQRLEALGATPGGPAEVAGLQGPAWLVSQQHTRALEEADPPVQLVDAATQMTLHLGQVLRARADEFVGIQETRDMLDNLEISHPTLVCEVVPSKVSLGTLSEVLSALVAEGVSIRDLRLILEALAGAAGENAALLVEEARLALRRTISHSFAGPTHTLRALVLDPSVEGVVRDSIQKTAAGGRLAMEPQLGRDIVAAVESSLPAHPGVAPVLLTRQKLRRHVRRLLEEDLPQLTVLAFEELTPDTEVETVGTVRPEGE